MPLWMSIVAVVALVLFIVLVVWLFRWKDASWDDEAQRKSFTWSKRGDGGGAG